MTTLYDMGFNASQINQIVKIEETGFKISKHIDVLVSVDDLRELKIMLSGDKYSNRTKGVITRFYTKYNVNVCDLVDKGFLLSCQLHLALEAKENNIDISSMYNKGYDYLQMKLIYSYLKKDIDITEYIDKGYDEAQIKIYLKLKEKGIDYDELNKKFKPSLVKQITHALQEDINPLPYIDETYSLSQLKGLIFALKQNVNEENVLKCKVNKNTMELIIKTMNDGYDLTPYVTTNTTCHFLTLITNCMRLSVDPTPLLEFETSDKKNFAYKLISNGLDTEFLKDYSISQCDILTKLLLQKEKSKIEDFFNANLSAEQMEYAYSLFKKDDENYKVFLKCYLSEPAIKKLQMAFTQGFDLSGYLYDNISASEINALMILKSKGYEVKLNKKP